MSDCEISEKFFKQCLEEKKEKPHFDCSFLEKAHHICLKKTTFSLLNKEIEESLIKNPRVPEKKICCACPETKKARDECNLQSDDCKLFIDVHQLCLKNQGFKVIFKI